MTFIISHYINDRQFICTKCNTLLLLVGIAAFHCPLYHICTMQLVQRQKDPTTDEPDLDHRDQAPYGYLKYRVVYVPFRFVKLTYKLLGKFGLIMSAIARLEPIG